MAHRPPGEPTLREYCATRNAVGVIDLASPRGRPYLDLSRLDLECRDGFSMKAITACSSDRAIRACSMFSIRTAAKVVGDLEDSEYFRRHDLRRGSSPPDRLRCGWRGCVLRRTNADSYRLVQHGRYSRRQDFRVCADAEAVSMSSTPRVNRPPRPDCKFSK